MRKFSFLLVITLLITYFSGFYPTKVFAADDKSNISELSGWYDENKEEYSLYTYEDICSFSYAVNNGHSFAGKTVTLCNDIDFQGQNFVPIGKFDKPFSGIFNGNGKVISHIKAKSTVNSGFFGVIKNAEINNVAIVDSEFSGVRNIGIIAGCAYDSVINGCYVRGTITAKNTNAGGIAGSFTASVMESSVSECVSDVTISCPSFSGGIAGVVNSTLKASISISTSCSFSEYSGGNHGGILGNAISYQKGTCYVNNCYIICSDDIIPFVCEGTADTVENVRLLSYKEMQDELLKYMVDTYRDVNQEDYGVVVTDNQTDLQVEITSEDTEISTVVTSCDNTVVTSVVTTPQDTEVSPIQTQTEGTTAPVTTTAASAVTTPETSMPYSTVTTKETKAVTEAVSSKIGFDVSLPLNTERDNIETGIKDYNPITVKPDNGIVTKNMLNNIKGKDIDLVIDMGYGVQWKINGKSVTQCAELSDINLTVNVTEFEDTAEFIDSDGCISIESLVIEHNGKFPFEAELSIPMGKAFTGNSVMLYYLDEQTGKYSCTGKSTVDQNGNVSFMFFHASSYAVVLQKPADISAGEAIKEYSEKIL